MDELMQSLAIVALMLLMAVIIYVVALIASLPWRRK